MIKLAEICIELCFYETVAHENIDRGQLGNLVAEFLNQLFALYTLALATGVGLRHDLIAGPG